MRRAPYRPMLKSLQAANTQRTDSKEFFIWLNTPQGHYPRWDYCVNLSLTEDAANDIMEYLKELHPNQEMVVSKTKPLGIRK